MPDDARDACERPNVTVRIEPGLRVRPLSPEQFELLEDAQLERLVPVHRVVDLTLTGEAVERELCLLKVVGKGDHRVEAMRLASAFGARTLDALRRAVGEICDLFDPDECWNYFREAGCVSD